MRGKIIKGIGGFYYVHVPRGGGDLPAEHENKSTVEKETLAAADHAPVYSDGNFDSIINGEEKEDMSPSNAQPVNGKPANGQSENAQPANMQPVNGKTANGQSVNAQPVNKQPANVWECRAKGIFRNQKKKPLIGDDVEIEAIDPQEKTGNIVKIYERTSELVRPSVANVDQALVVFAVASPEPSLNLLDRMLLMMETLDLPAGICFQKTDLDTEGRTERLCAIYRAAGYPVFPASAAKREGLEALTAFLDGRTTCLAGPSGVGKSTWMNLLCREERMETGNISDKTGRGKHTTRHTELIALWENTYLADTPGFGALDVPYMEPENLKSYFPEFAPYEGTCRFPGCVHRSEPGCSVKEAVERGEISRSRYDSYEAFYEDLKERKKNYYK